MLDVISKYFCTAILFVFWCGFYSSLAAFEQSAVKEAHFSPPRFTVIPIETRDGGYPTSGLPLEIRRVFGDPNNNALPFGVDDLAYNMTCRTDTFGSGDVICRGSYLSPEIRIYKKTRNRGFVRSSGVKTDLRQEADLSFTEIEPGTQIEFHYDLSGRLEKIEGPTGRRIVIIRDSIGKVTQISDEAGRNITFTYSGNLIVRADFSAGGAVSYEYSTTPLGSKLRSISGPTGDVTTFGYDGSGILVSQSTPRGGMYTYEISNSPDKAIVRDSFGNLFQTINFDTSLTRTTVTDGLGLIASREFDFRELFIRETTSQGRLTVTDYDADMNIIRQRTNTDTKTYRYGNYGEMLMSSRATGETFTYEYDTFGRLVNAASSYGQTETFTFDVAGNIISHKWPTGGIFKYSYDASGNRIRIEDPDGFISDRTYNSLGFLTSRTGLSIIYDTYGYSIVRTNGIDTILITRDFLGRPKQLALPGGSQVEIAWSGAGPTKISSSTSGETQEYIYSAGRLINMRDAIGATTEFTYDPMRSITSYKNQLSDITNYAYDSASNLARITYPTNPLGAPHRNYQSDSERRISKYTRETGDIIEFLYDSAGRPAGRKANGITVATISYDSRGFPSAASDPLGTAIYTRNALGRATRIVYQNGTAIDWTYSAAERVTRIAGGGYITDLAYDSNGQLRSQVTEAGQITFNYDSTTSRPSRIDYPNGITAVYTYGPTGQTSRIEYRNVGSETIVFAISRDSAGRIFSTWRSDVNETTLLDYNFRNEIIRGDIVRSTDSNIHRYTYDSAGNRIRYQTNSGEINYRYDPGNLLDSGGVDYGYNLAGEIISIGSRNLTYDPEGRLRTDSTPQGVVTYDYDAFGNRIRSTVMGTSTWRLWDEDKNEIADADQSGNVVEFRYYIPGRMDSLMGFTRGNQTYFVLLDPAGNVALVVSETAAVVARYTYDAFQIRAGTSFDSVDNRFRFATRREEKSGEIYVRARSLDPSSGRFMQRDPLVYGNKLDPFSWNGYIYANNNPVTLKDPSGEFVPYAMLGLAALLGLDFGIELYEIAQNMPNGTTGYVVLGAWSVEITKDEHGEISYALVFTPSWIVWPDLAPMGT